jgi:hypothetical protein
MLQRYGYPEQSLSQMLISIESFVACLGIQRKSGGNMQMLYVMLHYHCGLLCARDKEFWREGGAAIVNQIMYYV